MKKLNIIRIILCVSLLLCLILAIIINLAFILVFMLVSIVFVSVESTLYRIKHPRRIICPACGRKNDINFNYCRYCEADLRAYKI